MGNSLVVQWLRLGAFTAEGPGSIRGWGTKIPQATWWHSQKKKKKPIWQSLPFNWSIWPFTFNMIINMIGFKSVILYFYLSRCFAPLFFFSCLLFGWVLFMIPFYLHYWIISYTSFPFSFLSFSSCSWVYNVHLFFLTTQLVGS